MDFDEPSPSSQVTAQPYLTYNNANTLPTADTPSDAQVPPAEASSNGAAVNQHDDLAPLRPPHVRANTSESLAGRRTSVQFLPQVQVEGSIERSRSRKPTRESGGRRMSSPPPPT